MTTVADIVRVLDRRFPHSLAEDWDVNGLSVGDPTATVETVLFAVDPTMVIVREAIDAGATMIVTHHPLMLRGVNAVATTSAHGAVVHAAISNGIALYNAHTNADNATGGVADALALAVGLSSTVPLVPNADDPTQGTGRVGLLAGPLSLGEFAERVAASLPRTAQGVRVAGDIDAMVTSVAVCGGSGDSFLEAARASGADVYLTGDLRHHPASSARELADLGNGKPYLVDVAHFSSEWSWLAAAADHVGDVASVVTIVSTTNTDPWTARYGA
jgi:dinuclear metal center YbgI/SA1388 family protein